MEGKTTLLPGEVCRYASRSGNHRREAMLNRQKSAEVIVPARRRPGREGPNMIVRVVHGKFEREAQTAENPDRELSSGGSGESTGD
ncbi:hypothetical protein [Alicyclobacillus macrosporangiidus]|uniref:hypothetical protein n=1 Tax=Alicyclobacillus macrosporangiidus TaxID=392015 RepID=UPI001587A350|nr:hypothetical protein [Alicyclobacillus macrosporangiidus]